MKKLTIALMILLIAVGIFKATAQNPGEGFKGRIAWSADGNFNDEDDWTASALALAIFAKSGLKDRLVHFDYNCILPKTNEEWEAYHKRSVMGAVKLFGYDETRFYDCREVLDAAVNSITREVNASSENNPLFFILAGPMEVPFMGISRSDPEKRKYVYCISHSGWNDGYASGDLVKHNKRDIIPTGVTWIQVSEQNKWLNTSIDGAGAIKMDKSLRKDGDNQWKPWWWMRDSNDAQVRHIWDMLQMETRPDASDAGMAYFLVTGDEEAELSKIKILLEDSDGPPSIKNRKIVRMEAENFVRLNGFAVEYINERICSQRISIKYSGSAAGEISTEFKEIMVSAENTYDITVHFYTGNFIDTEYGLYVNDKLQGNAWKAPDTNRWQLNTVQDASIKIGDCISVRVKSRKGSGIKIDYLDLVNVKENNPYFTTPVMPLHNSMAMPGQLVVAEKSTGNPGYLAYNGVGPAFLCGPDNPETFLWTGDQYNADGTVVENGQAAMIRSMADNNVNAFHLLLFRMKKCNYKGEGDDRHAPFIDNDPAKGLNQAVLDQWEKWFTLFEENGIAISLEIYNDATDVELMGWTLQADGNLHPDEYRFIRGIVERFRHHKNILWGLEESANKLVRDRVVHFKKVAELIKKTDNYNHPVVQSFVVQNDPENDFQAYSGLPDDYIGDPNIDVITWLHVVPHGNLYEEQYDEYSRLYDIGHENFVMMKNETFHHPRSGMRSRVYMWSCTMTKTHSLEAYHHANGTDPGFLFEDGLISTFMEGTDYQNMEPRNDLKFSDANWVLANPGRSYIVYSYDCESGLGLKQMTNGICKLKWMDTASGQTITQYNIPVNWGNNNFRKPSSLGREVVVYISRQ